MKAKILPAKHAKSTKKRIGFLLFGFLFSFRIFRVFSGQNPTLQTAR